VTAPYSKHCYYQHPASRQDLTGNSIAYPPNVNELTTLVLTLCVGLAAGFIRGLTGFGGPAFILAALTLVLTPMAVIGKILIVELIAASYLVIRCRDLIRWRDTLSLAIPTLATMPLGYWILVQTDPELMRRLIAAAIILSCVLMAVGWRYREPLGRAGLFATGAVGGIVFGASYIALLVVAVLLMGPYQKAYLRALFVSWGWMTAVFFLGMSVVNGDTDLPEIYQALPLAVFYFAGTWLGSQRFDQTAEKTYRRYALITLVCLALAGFL
jgi:uncharacterized membrane protein YfcA